jgi:hypothetical protein
MSSDCTVIPLFVLMLPEDLKTNEKDGICMMQGIGLFKLRVRGSGWKDDAR